VVLQGDCESVLEARNADEFRAVVLRFAKRLGFDFAGAMAVIDRPGRQSEFFFIDNLPEQYNALACDPERIARDPVMQSCKRSSLPIIWSRDTYVQCDAIDMWEAQAPFGFCAGIATALHLPRGRHFLMGVDRDQALPRNASEVARMTAELSLFAVHAQDVALRLFDEAPDIEPLPLSTRELEVLRWTMDGFTAQQVGNRLGIAERTVNMHSRSAMKKLGCGSKHQAVLKALRLGWI
jgi:DNA-binding CsgD family transcriptional regulator